MSAEHCHWIVSVLAVLGVLANWLRHNWRIDEIKDVQDQVNYFNDDLRRRLQDQEERIAEAQALAPAHSGRPGRPRHDLQDK